MSRVYRGVNQRVRYLQGTNTAPFGDTLLSFLYETKTIRRVLRSCSSTIQRRCYSAANATPTSTHTNHDADEHSNDRSQAKTKSSLADSTNDGFNKQEKNWKDSVHKAPRNHHPHSLQKVSIPGSFKRLSLHPNSKPFDRHAADLVQNSGAAGETVLSQRGWHAHQQNQPSEAFEGSTYDRRNDMRFRRAERTTVTEYEVEADDIDSLPSNRENTMTGTEKKIFKGIFADLTHSLGIPQHKSMTIPKQSEGESKSSATAITVEDDYAPRMLAEVDEGRQLDIDSNDSELDKIMDLGGMAGVYPSIIESYPPQLRDIALKTQMALRNRKDGAEAEINGKPGMSEAGRLAILQVEEVRRVEKLFRDAQTDLRLWEILDAEVLKQVRALKLDSPKGQGQTAAKTYLVTSSKAQAPMDETKRAAQREEKNQEAAVEATDPKTSPAKRKNILEVQRDSLAILSKAYPALLLIAVRILCRNTNYTPVVETILPAIKMIGFSSYVMGVSTPLYNEILLHSWRTSHTMTTMLSLLSEMDGAGITFDIKTLGIINEVIMFRHRALQGDFGNGVQAVENMDERMREGDLLLKWKARIFGRMNEAEEERVRRRMDERRMDEAMKREEEALGLDAVT